MNQPASAAPLESFGRYVLHPPIARGGMATVHTARLVAAEGVSRLVAAKRLHPELTDDPDFVEMFNDEARIASKIHHPNVVPVLDVIVSGQEVILVQEYVHGVPLSQLLKAAITDHEPIDTSIAVAVMMGVLAGLHAAHEATDEQGEPLHVVHRDVSPQNILVSVDGVPRLVDFGIAKARTSSHHTREGVLKGKLAYMSPEQLRGEQVTRRADVYAAGVVLWELLANKRFHDGKTDIEFVAAIAKGERPSVTDALGDAFVDGDRHADLVALEPVVMRALAVRAEERYASAAEMLQAIADACPPASPIEVAEWVKATGADFLDRRQRALASNDESWRTSSKMPLSIPTDASGVKPVFAREDMPVSIVAPHAAFARPDLVRYLPWAVAAGLLMVVGVLLGMVAMRGRASEPTPIVVTAPTTALPAATAPGPVAQLVPVPPADPPAQAAPEPPPKPAPVVVRWSPPPRPVVVHAPPPPPVMAAPPPPAPTAAASAAAKPDCNPPFYYEGTKKVFKPACL